VFLKAGLQKLIAGDFATKLPGIFDAWVTDNPFPWYKAFLTGVAMPHSDVFAFLVPWGEALVGITLILGIGVGIGCFFAMFMCGNYYFAGGHTSPAVAGTNLTMVVTALTLWGTKSGRYLGLDVIVRRNIRINWLY
jgi:thiosulfate dehydrogenase [quinone] large subunit